MKNATMAGWMLIAAGHGAAVASGFVATGLISEGLLMTDEFERIDGAAQHRSGFTVWTGGSSGVLYKEGGKTLRISSEWMTGTPEIVLYPYSRGSEDLQLIDLKGQEEILQRVIAALEFPGHTVEIER